MGQALLDMVLPARQTGPCQTAMMRLRAKCIARYRLKAGRLGHPEELDQIGHEELGISIVYGCFAVRVRLHHDHRPFSHLDLPRGRELHAETIRRLFDVLDPHFGWSPRGYPIHGGDQPDAGGLLDPKLSALTNPNRLIDPRAE